jgi:hypothetical protein
LYVAGVEGSTGIIGICAVLLDVVLSLKKSLSIAMDRVRVSGAPARRAKQVKEENGFD